MYGNGQKIADFFDVILFSCDLQAINWYFIVQTVVLDHTCRVKTQGA
jgi:hypothetical protein